MNIFENTKLLLKVLSLSDSSKVLLYIKSLNTRFENSSYYFSPLHIYQDFSRNIKLS